LFEKLTLKFKKSTFDKATDISKTRTSEFNIPLINAKFGDNGIMYYGRKNDFETASMTIDIVNDGAISTASVYPQPQETGVLYNAYLIKPLFDVNNQILYFLSTTIQKSIKEKFGYENKAGWEKVKKEFIQLPTKNGKIDFEFMNAYISELEEERISELEEERISELSAYLTVSGLDNYELSSEEKEALEIYNDMVFDEYKFKDIFNNIKQGRRLKKDDQIIGNIPFVMSGRTNTGVVGYISNPIALFSKNSITIDIFGNSFYRNYDFGAGDDTGIYWNSEVQYPKETMLYFTTAMEKALFGKYSYGKKLRSSQSFNFKMQLPTKNNEIDFTYMELLISAVKKLVIKDVVLYADNKINATKKVISKN